MSSAEPRENAGRGRGRGRRRKHQGGANFKGKAQEGGDNPSNGTSALRKPIFIKVEQLQPGTARNNLVVKVVQVNTVLKRNKPDGSEVTLAECLVGDETGCVIFTARNEQLEKMKKGSTVIIRNGNVELFNGRMRLKIDSWGQIRSFEEGTKGLSVPLSDQFVVKEDKNVSTKEYKVCDPAQ